MPPARVHRFRRVLSDVPEAPGWPEGFSLVPFTPSRDARTIHALLVEGYRDGGGSVAGFTDWWSALNTDAEYDPDLIFLVANRSGAPAATAICWASAYVKDLVVAAAERRQGLASSLLRHIFWTFHKGGAGAVDLKVHAENHAAITLYRALGMTCVEPAQL
jgi:ribosomal protein S18 acetylase RimI-like enzyme